MQDGDVLFESNKITALFAELCESKPLLELRLEGDEQLYGAHLLRVDPAGGEMGLVISPLEPTGGNLRIRRSPGIMLGVFSDLFVIEGKVEFRQVVPLEGGQGICLGMPKVVQIHRRRIQERLIPPAEWRLAVMAARRGENARGGEVSDLSEGGVSFVCQANQCPLSRGDRLRLELTGSARYVPSAISLGGVVCYHARSRRADNLNETVDRFGVRFEGLSPTQEMQLGRLVKGLQTLLSKG